MQVGLAGMTEPLKQDVMADDFARAEQLLRHRFAHKGFLAGQEQAIRSALAGRNLLVVMPTGSGKSLLYQLPALLAEGLTLVISPLIALMKDQVDDLTRRGISATFINSSLGLDEQRGRIQQCLNGQVKLLYVAPERFRSSSFVDMLGRVPIARMAVDEAHCISEWGHDFRPDYRRLKQFRHQMGNPLVTALTATATPRVQSDIVHSLGFEESEVELHVHGFDRPNLALGVVRAASESDKNNFVVDFIRRRSGAGIIYTGTRKTAEKLTALLLPIEPRTALYHAGLDPEQRSRAQESFLGGKARLAVATIAFGMGIDKADVRFVLHYHLPGSVEEYYQQIGRAGRDGAESECVLLHCPADRFLREFFIDLSHPTRQQVACVMEALYRVSANPIMLTYKQIAELCDEPVKEGQVGASLRLLSEAGIARPLAGGPDTTITLQKPGAEIISSIRGQIQKRVFEALAAAVDLETPGTYSVNLDQVAAAAQLSAVQVHRAIIAMDRVGQLGYEPPFRGRGVEKLLSEPPPFEQAEIDWDRQDFLRGIEEEKLAAMESFIHGRGCRRGFILRYFGEKSDLVCGTCDRCVENAGSNSDEAGSVLQRHGAVAGAVLVCTGHLRFPLGVERTAQVVT
ncbi:MAG: RecQ family ATP-dependent DNA helicase, partial [Planctomycetes bacterium]|nr:RecQ family ATP-dependent DNA helicase [Planctomycetota bacterium]